MTRSAPDSDGSGIGAPGRDQRITDHGTDGHEDDLGVNGTPRGNFHRVIVAAPVERPVARGAGLTPPLHLADIGQWGGPVLAGQEVTGLTERRGDRGEQLAVA
jgi:hypothetical protein